MNEAQPREKILRGTEGVGTVTAQMIEERAREIAHSDGRAQTNDVDRTRARQELTCPTSGSERPPTKEDARRNWQIPLVSTGEKSPTVRPEDEQSMQAKLIEEGVEEADHDHRVSSGKTRERHSEKPMRTVERVAF